MKKIVYIVLAVIFIISCSKGRDVKQLIAGDSCQYWYKPTPDSLGKTKYYVYLDLRGKRVFLEERYFDKKCYLYDGGDVYYKQSWSLINDSIIMWGDKERKLSIISDSVIALEDKKWNIFDTLYKVTNPHLLKKLQEVKIP